MVILHTIKLDLAGALIKILNFKGITQARGAVNCEIYTHKNT